MTMTKMREETGKMMNKSAATHLVLKYIPIFYIPKKGIFIPTPIFNNQTHIQLSTMRERRYK